MRRLYALRPTRSFTQRVQAITQHQPRSAGILDDLREISRLALTGAAPMTAADRGHFNYANRIQRPMDETVLLGNDTMDVTKLTQLSVLSLTRRTSLQQSRLAELLVRQAVRLLPQNHRDRYEEEWLAELAQVQGRFPPLMMALRILAGTRSMVRVLRRQSVRSLNSTLPVRRSKATGISLTVAVTTLVGLCYFCLVNGMLNRQRATLAFLIALSLGILTFRVARRKWPSTGSNNGRVFDQRKTRTWQKAYWQLNAGVMSVNDDLRRVWQRAAGFGKPLNITVARTFDDLMLVVNYIAGSTLNTVKTHVSSAVFRNRVAQHGRPTRRTTEAEARPSPTSSWSSSRGPTATKATRR